MRQGGVEIGRLRVHGDTDPLRLRLGVERVLGAADLVGTRLPPAAVLVVRSLRDPLPGRVDATGAAPDRDWEQRVRDEIDDLVVRAARPAAATPDPAAAAVVFSDRAELLACAWRELRHSGRAGSWWWRALRLDDVPRLLTALVAEAYAVPAAVVALERSGDLERCTDLLGVAAVESLAAQVASAFGRPGLVVELRQGLVVVAAPPVPTRRARPAPATPDAPPPPRAPAAAVPLDPAALARSVLTAVCRAVMTPAPPPGRPSTTRPSSPVRRAGTPAQPRPRHEEPGSAAAGQEGSSAPPHPDASPVRRPDAADVDVEVEVEVEVTPGLVPAPLPRPDRPSAPSRHEAPVLREAGADAGEGVQTVTAAPMSEEVVATSLGGVFHLVQVGQALGLYDDFTSPVPTGLRLGLWDFVSMVAGGLGVGSPRDPVWRLLADLEGRDRARAPGLGFRPPRVWRTPQAWLAPIDVPGPWRWRDDTSRQALLHPTGCVVAEGASLDRERECARYSVTRCLDATPAPYDGPARARWLAHLSAYLRVRLSCALGGRPSRAGRTLCRRPALVHVTQTRVDVVSELVHLPIEVRRAGLDRDLGFVPAVGRAIGFVFR